MADISSRIAPWLSFPPFYKLWSASAVSNLADGIGLTAAPLLAATLTRDPLLVSGLVFAQRLPWLLFVLVSGALVDRLDRRNVMHRSNIARGLLLGLLGLTILTNWINLPILYIVFFMLGTIETLFDNAALAVLPAIVPQDQLEHANGRLFATGTLANEMVGPPLGSYLFAIIRSTPFILAAGAYSLSAMVIGLIPGQFKSVESDPKQKLHQSIREGLEWFLKHRLLRTIGLMAATYNFVFSGSMAIFVLFTQDVLGLGEAAYGLLISFGAIGGIIGSLVANALSNRFGPGRVLFVEVFASSLAMIGIGLTTHAWVVGTMFIIISMSSMIGNVILISLRQAIIPDHLLGRVASAYRLFVIGAVPLGALFGGVVARQFELATPFWIGGFLLMAAAFAMVPIVNNQTIAAAKQPVQ